MNATMHVYETRSWDAVIRYDGFEKALKQLGVTDAEDCGPWLFRALDSRKTGQMRWLEVTPAPTLFCFCLLAPCWVGPGARRKETAQATKFQPALLFD